jgi:uncharacterized protein YdhG (YjbR/CyaY superfamily)
VVNRKASPRKPPDRRGSGDVDAYLAALPSDSQQALQQLRKSIRALVPEAEEGFSYGLPAFRLKGRPLVCYSASQNHCSLYPMSPAVIRSLAADLKGFETSKGTIKFTPKNPLPTGLVRKIVKARIAELQPDK